ncbi:MAG: hypothetical protein ACOYOB_01680 [Myxococcota bacterium]|jgi:hypothetical protein
MNQPFDCAEFADAIRAALTQTLTGVDVAEEPGDDASALTFVHPVHEATVVLLVEAADNETSVPTLLVSIVIGDWLEAQEKEGGAQLFALNPRLMTCAVGLMPLNDDEIAVVLCRRAPAAAIAADEVLGVIDDMIWDYANCAGWLEGASDPAIAGGRSRLISSLDEV